MANTVSVKREGPGSPVIIRPMLLLILLVLLGMLIGCSSRSSRPMEIIPGDVFTLGQGQEAVVQSEDLHVRFDSVLEDSRCPTQVTCVWSGQARIAVAAWQDQEEPVMLEFNTNPVPAENQQALTYSSYTIQLESLDPYPQTPEQSIEQADYRVTLQINSNR